MSEPHSRSEAGWYVRDALDWLDEFTGGEGGPYLVTEAMGALNHALVSLVSLEEQLETYCEFYEAWWVVEEGVTDFELHHDAVTRLRAAMDAVVALGSSPASSPS